VTTDRLACYVFAHAFFDALWSDDDVRGLALMLIARHEHPARGYARLFHLLGDRLRDAARRRARQQIDDIAGAVTCQMH
jgi:hypothetical protein